MISDKERRAVAARMREIMRDDPHGWLDVMVSRAVADVLGDGVKIGETVADLIDRPTCHLELTDVETHGNAKVRIYECSECGRTCEEIYGKYERCPHCGCEVVEDD